MDILEELKARDERIEKLERALLLVLSLNIGNHLDKSTKNCFSHVQTFRSRADENPYCGGWEYRESH